ncbi:ABC transporter permease subunit [Nitriliruptor alkaliphilus]|uniref:ABC transporter permease subunit n=1 Tax=Nitriliruptor alkaliphilus TaxID=427918 RepID=UPI000697E3FB|nr:ABC transporter permease [Nitriliruptor alkaliphilus]
MRAFTSEWVKLSRRTTLVGFGGTMIGVTLLFTTLAFEGAGGRSIDLDGSGSDALVTTAMLSMPEGSILVATDMAGFFGVVALALFASNLAGEFHKGTIRMLFVTEPNRLKVLAGKLLALSSFVAAGIAATLAASIGSGVLMAERVGVETSAWWTADGLAAIGAAYINLSGAALVPALIGATLAVLTRSTAIAVSVGLGWFILAEPLIGAFWDGLSRWGPAAASDALAAGAAGAAGMFGGATAEISYATATLLVTGYSLAALTITATLLTRRDVTS